MIEILFSLGIFMSGVAAQSNYSNTTSNGTTIANCSAAFGNYTSNSTLGNCSYSINGSHPINGTSNGTILPLKQRKVFLDNDGLVPLNLILPLLGGMEVVGVSGSFGDPSLPDAMGQAADVLSNYSVSECIPLYAGASQPFLRTQSTFETWESLFGELVWKGAWDPGYKDSYNLSDVEYNDDIPAAMALIQAAKKYPGELEIYAAGLMTTVAQAVSMWPELVDNVKALWIMGGYVDFQYLQVTGDSMVNDINTDFNLMFDPEAAEKVLTAGFQKVYIGGNVTNYLFPPQSMFDKFIDEFTYEEITSDPQLFAISNFIGTGNASDVSLPLWDEAVSAYMAFPEFITDTTEVSVAVDTAFESPFYGNLRVWPYTFKPKRGRWANATYVNSVDHEAIYEKIYSALALDWSTYCAKNSTVYPYQTK